MNVTPRFGKITFQTSNLKYENADRQIRKAVDDFNQGPHSQIDASITFQNKTSGDDVIGRPVYNVDVPGKVPLKYSVFRIHPEGVGEMFRNIVALHHDRTMEVEYQEH